MLILDAHGAPRGRTLAASRHTQFNEGSVPSWITTDPTTTGTAGEGTSYALQPGLDGGLLASVPAVANRRATIYGPELDLTKYAVVRVRARALLNRDAGSENYGVFSVGFADDANSRGAQAGNFINNNATLAQVSVTAGGVARYAHTHMPNVVRGKWQDLSVWIDCRTKDVHVGVGNQVQSIWPAAGAFLELGLVKPRLRVVTHGPGKSAMVQEFGFQAWR